jgi:hypothetical protein
MRSLKPNSIIGKIKEERGKIKDIRVKSKDALRGERRM